MKARKKLIEVALPLEAINEEGSRRKRKAPAGYPTSLHKWWAQRPLAAARAVIFAQMVDDPSEYVDTLLSVPETRRAAERELKKRRAVWEAKPDDAARGPEPTIKDCAADIERQRLFKIIEDLVLWENTTNEAVLERARAEIWQSWRRACVENVDHPRAKELFDRNKLPAFYDPFAGGGSLPLEAQRLGLEAHASDLNPVAVLINKAMIEIPPKFAGRPPVNPEAWTKKDLVGRTWKGAQGLAEDVRYYGRWMRDEAEKRIGHLYPPIEITAELAKERPDLKPLVGRKLTVIAWLWARTVRSTNPAFAHVEVPLASTFMLSTKPGKEAYVDPVIEDGGYRFTVKVGKPKDAELAKNGTKLTRGANFRCLMSRTPIAPAHIYAEANAARMGARLMAIVAEGERGRVYLSPTPEHEIAASIARPEWKPDVAMPENPRWFSPPLYGLKTFGDLFTPRQLVALTTFSDLLGEARAQVKRDALAARLLDDAKSLAEDGTGTKAYADSVALYLAFGVSRAADYGSSIATWRPKDSAMRSGLAKQAIPMVWDFAEGSPFGKSSAGFLESTKVVAEVIIRALGNYAVGTAFQSNAIDENIMGNRAPVVCTDPPYYANVGYADLSDFFFVWLRRSLKEVFPDLFAILTVPKAEELIASPYRHGNKEKADAFFLEGMTRAMHRLADQTHPDFPVTIFYAVLQAEEDQEEGLVRTGWETFLDAAIRAGFAIGGTWPMRTEGDNRQTGIGANALASSIVLVCRPRDANAPTATRREFQSALKAELPVALAHLQRGNIAPVDLAQAAIGPGMAIYTRYAKVLDAEGKPFPVRAALALINQTLDEVLAEQEGDFDGDTRWALAWFEQSGFDDGEFGVAETLSKAKNTSVEGMKDAGILKFGRGKVRLLRPAELFADWDPTSDKRLTVWEMVHHLVRVLEAGGEAAAAELMAKLGAKAEVARELAYRLYALCERKKRAPEALAYNALVQSWPEIARLARERAGSPERAQAELFGNA